MAAKGLELTAAQPDGSSSSSNSGSSGRGGGGGGGSGGGGSGGGTEYRVQSTEYREQSAFIPVTKSKTTVQ